MNRLLAAILLCASSATHASDATGSVCVAPAPRPAPGDKSLANPAGGNRVRSFVIGIDRTSPVAVSHRDPVEIANLPLTGRHFVRIDGDGKPFASFRFRFGDYGSPRLCLLFKPLYETWLLTEAENGGSFCRCRAASLRPARQ